MGDDMIAKREFVKSLYPGDKWRNRVDKMRDDQVIAIYLRKQQEVDSEPKKEGEDEIPF
jgi:hypothetical protein